MGLGLALQERSERGVFAGIAAEGAIGYIVLLHHQESRRDDIIVEIPISKETWNPEGGTRGIEDERRRDERRERISV